MGSAASATEGAGSSFTGERAPQAQEGAVSTQAAGAAENTVRSNGTAQAAANDSGRRPEDGKHKSKDDEMSFDDAFNTYIRHDSEHDTKSSK